MPFGPNAITTGYGHSQYVANGLSAQVLQYVPAQSPANTIITGGSIDNTPIGQSIPAAGAFTTLTATNPLGVASGGSGISTLPGNGKLLIGNGTGYTLANLTAGSGISITNASGSITIAQSNSPGTVTSVAASGGSTGLTFSGSPITTSGTLTLGGTLAIGNGGTNSTTASGARTNLGLDTMATQASTNVSITGGAIDGTAIGTTTQSTGKFTTVTATGVSATRTDGNYQYTLASATKTYGLATSGSTFLLDDVTSSVNRFAITGSGVPSFSSLSTNGFVKATGGVGTLTTSPTVSITSEVSGLGTGIATFLSTPTSANLAAAVTDESGTGNLLFSVSPAMTGTPTVPTAAAGDNTTKVASTAYVQANRGDKYLTTSTSTNTIDNGNGKTFNVDTGLSYIATQTVTVVFDFANHMHCDVVSYDKTTGVMVVNSVSHSGSGTYSAWTINLGGLTSASGALLSANNLSDVASASTSATNLGLGAASSVTHGSLTLTTALPVTSGGTGVTTATGTGSVVKATAPTLVGLKSLDDTGGYQIIAGQQTGGDRMGIAGQASGSGTALVFFDNAQSTFRPSIFDASSHSFKIGGVATTSITSTGFQGAIGATTANTGRFTTVTATSTISGSNLSGTNTGDQTTITGNAGSATVLQTSRSIYGGSFNGSADVTNIIASTYGGTGNGFTKFSGPTTAEKTFTLPDSSATLLYSGGALGTPSSGTVTNLTGTASININGTVGATTANTGAFTTLTVGPVGSGSYRQLITDNDQSGNRLRFTNTGSGGQSWSIVGGSPGASNAGLAIYNETGSATVAQFSSTGLAVTGALSSTTGFSTKGNSTFTEPTVGTTSCYLGMSTVGAYFGTAAAKPVYFETNGTERLRIDSSGNVGIGTTSPRSVANYTSLGLNNTTGVLIDGFVNGTRTSGIATTVTSMTVGTITSIPLTFLTGDTERARIDSSGNLLVGTTSTSGNAGIQFLPNSGVASIDHVSGTSSGAFYYSFNYAGSSIGSVSQIGTSAVLYNTTSDYRRKSNVKDLTGSGMFIDALKPRTFDWDSGEKGVGFIAHEFAEVSPSSVVGEKDAVDADGKPIYQAMQASSAEVIANLVAELQSVRQRLAALESN